LGESNIGILNLNDENSGGTYKLKLQLSDLKTCALFEGEIIVVEGVYDQSQANKLNVMAITKPILPS
jgi:hypothetical protein